MFRKLLKHTSFFVFLIAIGILFLFLSYYISGYLMLQHLEKSYNKINITCTRNDVKKILSDFKEIKCEIVEIPEIWQNSLIKKYANLEEKYITYMYIYYFSPFSFFVIYDEHEKVVIKIPTYE